MSVTETRPLIAMFSSRLDTLEHLLRAGHEHYSGDDGYMHRRLIADMHPLGTQVAFTCNQPRNFSLWAQGKPTSDLDPDVRSLQAALAMIEDTRQLLAGVNAEASALPASKRLDFGPAVHANLTADQYIQDFLVPNFYFHLVTAYGILRMSGVKIGKPDYMLHLVPFVTQSAA